MDIKYAILNLSEAKEHIDQLIDGLRTSGSVNALEAELYAAYREVYWHLNKVWNARGISQQKIHDSTEQQFDAWCRFPEDFDIG